MRFVILVHAVVTCLVTYPNTMTLRQTVQGYQRPDVVGNPANHLYCIRQCSCPFGSRISLDEQEVG